MTRPRSAGSRPIRLPKRLAKHLAGPWPDRASDESEHADDMGRRRRTVAFTGVAGASLLGVSLSVPPGSRRFYVLTLGVAGTWAVGALRSGPVPRGRVARHDGAPGRPVVAPVLTGIAAFGVFYGSARVIRHVPVLNDAVARVLQFADRGRSPLVVLTTCFNGVAEEVFFRGALYSALGTDHPVLRSTAAYSVATAATRNPALVLASMAMGTLFGLQRRATGGVQAPALTHLTWSILMLRYLPPLFREHAKQREGTPMTGGVQRFGSV